MIKQLGLSAMHSNMQYASLAALGSFFQQQDFFAPLREHVQLGCKTVIHTLHEKLFDVVVSMLADHASLKQINTPLLPDPAFATAWGREGADDLSTLTRVVEAFTLLAVGAVADRRRAAPPT